VGSSQPTTLSSAAPHADQRVTAETATHAIAIGVANVHCEPDETSEVVTQTLLGAPANVLGDDNGWVHVRLTDYEGWIQGQLVAEAAKPTDKVAVVTELQTSIYMDETSDLAHSVAYVTTALPALETCSTSERVCVALPGSAIGWLDTSAVAIRPATEPFPRGSVGDALALAQRMIGVPYLWGGTTLCGVDCSGLAQLCWRHAGIMLRRDADQQYESIPYIVARGEMRAGDLAFFALNGHVVHVGLMLDGMRILHADGTVRHQVTINCLAPEAEDYSPRLDELYAGARRPLP
jgi:cell wall-associated NlpC family hydrolase